MTVIKSDEECTLFYFSLLCFLILGAKSAHLLLRLKTHEGQQTCALIAFKIHEKILNADFKSEKRNVAFSMRKIAN